MVSRNRSRVALYTLVLATGLPCIALAGNGATQRLVARTPAELAHVQAAGRSAAEAGGDNWVEDYGSFAVVHGDTSWVPGAARERGDLTALEETLHFPGSSFDPLVADPGAGKGVREGYFAAEDAGRDYYVLQFAAPAKDGWIEELARAGVEFVQYVPHQAFLVRAEPAAVAAARGHARVRWIGRYQPAYRLPAVLDWVFGGKSRLEKGANPGGLEGFGANGPAIYDVAIARGESLDQMASRMSADGATIRKRIELPNNYFHVLRVEMTPDEVARVAARPGVITIDPWTPPQAEDEIAAQIVAGNYTGTATISPGYDPATQFGVSGTNVTISIVDDGVGIPGDGGFYIAATNAVNGPLRGAAAGANGHGHLNATITSGAAPFGPLGGGFNFGLGVAPASHVINIPLLRTGYTGVEADTVNDTVTTNGPNGVPGFISNNSWGAGTNGNAYDSLAAQYDGFVRDSSTAAAIDPLVIAFSAGNSGTGGLTRPKVAKNVISVAATENVRPTQPSAGGTTGVADNLEQLPDFSSRGPAADTRIKPDLSAPGDAVTGGRSGPDALFGDVDINHRVSSGTSHAVPQVAGAAALFTQFWKIGHAGANPSPALVKAVLINSTVEVTGTGALTARPNGDEGWGRVRLNNILNTGVATHYVNQTIPLTSPGQVASLAGTVASVSQPFRVSLVWTDPPGTVDPALVNNLDLEVTVGGNSYRGNVFAAGSSVTGGVADTRNNVENVFVAPGAAAGSPFSVVVRATSLNGDGILGDADVTDQHFALVVFNGVETPTAVPSGTTGSLTADNCSTPFGGGWMDPGEGVIVSLCVDNVGSAATSALTGTLQATGGVQTPSGPQNYGAIPAGGPAACRPFNFGVDAGLSCGSTLTASLQLQDGPTNFGTATYLFQVGSSVVSGPTAFTNTATILIPATGTSGIAAPYPSPIVVSGLLGSITDVDVTLTGFNQTFPDDVDVLLVSPTGQTVVVMSDAGGSTDAVNVNLTFNQGSPSLPDAGPIVSGTFGPTNVGTGDAFAAPAPAGPHGSTLAGFNGTSPNGTWNLFVVDDLGGDAGNFSGGWSLSITTAQPVCNNACVFPVELRSIDVD